MVSKKTGLAILAAITLLLFAFELSLQPILQRVSYHNFADQRSWLGVPNAWNVLSNISFALAGAWGLYLLFLPGKVHFVDERQRFPWIFVSIGLILTAIGSSYYHLAPNNARLVFDRLPITIIFMSYVTALISERINVLLSLWLWPLLLISGFYSVLLTSGLYGNSDIRFYLGVQVFTFLASLVMLLMRSPYTRNFDIVFVLLLFGIGRVFEIFDHQIYFYTHDVISGHTLKHLVDALAGAWLIRMIYKRKIIEF